MEIELTSTWLVCVCLCLGALFFLMAAGFCLQLVRQGLRLQGGGRRGFSFWLRLVASVVSCLAAAVALYQKPVSIDDRAIESVTMHYLWPRRDVTFDKHRDTIKIYQNSSGAKRVVGLVDGVRYDTGLVYDEAKRDALVEMVKRWRKN